MQRVVPLLLALAVLTGGCLSGAIDGTVTPLATAETPATDRSATPAESPSATTGMATDETPATDWIQQAANEPDPDKQVSLANHWNRTVTIRLQVIRNATDTTVHDEQYDLAPGVERPVFNTSTVEPNGIETFTIVLSARNDTQRISIETNACYGNAYAEIRDDGSPYLYYAIC
jgi:hypothetical protein